MEKAVIVRIAVSNGATKLGGKTQAHQNTFLFLTWILLLQAKLFSTEAAQRDLEFRHIFRMSYPRSGTYLSKSRIFTEPNPNDYIKKYAEQTAIKYSLDTDNFRVLPDNSIEVKNRICHYQ